MSRNHDDPVHDGQASGASASGSDGLPGSEVLALRSRVRALAADLSRSIEYLSRVRNHQEQLFASRRWRIASGVVEWWARVRGRPRQPAAEDHLLAIYREIDAWDERRHSATEAMEYAAGAGSQQPPTSRPTRPDEEKRNLGFYQFLEDLRRSGAASELDRVLEESETRLSFHLASGAPRSGSMFSIVLPTWERSHVLPEAIRSVREQSHADWELLVADDGSTDDTADLMARLDDPRIRYLPGTHAGAAAARNRALAEARGDLIAYLDSDNLWHPDYLAAMASLMDRHEGHLSAFAGRIEVEMEAGGSKVSAVRSTRFDFEALVSRNFIDLNAFVHRRELFEVLGGFDERLRRQQDWDLIIRYTSVRDPLLLDVLLTLYRRNARWNQITITEARDQEAPRIVEENQQRLHDRGPMLNFLTPRPSVSILSWDISRNHFSKAFSLAEAWSRDRDVELVGFRFFEDEIYPPYAGVNPSFDTRYYQGASMPGFHERLAEALASIRGDVVYAVKPRLPSLGLALLANFHFGKQVILEINDLESEVANPSRREPEPFVDLEELRGDQRLLDPTHRLWSKALEGLARELPLVATHNQNLHSLFGGRSHQMRNPRDETVWDPRLFDRDEARRRLGFGGNDIVLLFAGTARRHKGIFELAEFIGGMKDDRCKLLVVGSRETPDQRELERKAGDRLQILSPRAGRDLAEITVAADATVLWLDPRVAVSHYQMPYKLSDAFAMELPVIANPISDLAGLGQLGCLRTVEYGDHARLIHTLRDIISDTTATREMTRRARRLFLRQFSYRAARTSLELMLRCARREPSRLGAGDRFARFYSEIYEQTRSMQPRT